MLVGRGAERARIDALLEEARAGRSGVLVLLGDAGIGKSALLAYAAERAEGFRIIRAVGIESESELPFSALHELIAPLVGQIAALPKPQANALRAALALAPGVEIDRFAVSAGLLSLLAEASHAEPLLGLVDDLQWVDRASWDALRFAARRLHTDAAAILVAQRTADERWLTTPELPKMMLGGLHVEAARSLLESAAPTLKPHLAARVIELADGNPLALLEVPEALQRAPAHSLDDPLPIGPRLEAVFARRIEALDEAARRALVVAAASDVADLSVIDGALMDLGLDAEALDAAERAALLSIQAGEIRFRHPLARSAIYRGAPAGERRRAHRALASTLRRSGAEARAAWHLAAATVGADEEVAAALEAAAHEARIVGGLAAAGRALERAARISPDPLQRSRRLVEAAGAARAAGNAGHARRLLDDAVSQPCDERTWAATQALLADLAYWEERTADLLQLEASVDRLAETDRTAAAVVLLRIAMAHGSSDIEQALELSERALRLEPGNRYALAVKANYLFRLGRVDEALATSLATADAARGAEDWSSASEAAVMLGDLERYDEADSLAQAAVAGLRTNGALKDLSHALCAQVHIGTRRGDLRAAYEAGLTALGLADDLDEPLQVGFAASFLAACEAWMGLESATREHAAQALAAVPGERARTSLEAHAALGFLELQLGNPELAIAELQPVVAVLQSLAITEPGYVQALPELVEALARDGRLTDAERALVELERQAQATRRRWALAAAARCRALIADDGTLDDAFSTALELHRPAGRPLEEARTRLAYGERLRRAGRRTDARAQLRSALAIFDRAGARLLAKRATAELAASGERLRKTAEAREELTPQERQVAFAVARGATNNEAAAELFISPKTIEFHLRNAFRKLGVRSRTELANVIRGLSPRA